MLSYTCGRITFSVLHLRFFGASFSSRTVKQGQHSFTWAAFTRLAPSIQGPEGREGGLGSWLIPVDLNKSLSKINILFFFRELR